MGGKIIDCLFGSTWHIYPFDKVCDWVNDQVSTKVKNPKLKGTPYPTLHHQRVPGGGGTPKAGIGGGGLDPLLPMYDWKFFYYWEDLRILLKTLGSSSGVRMYTLTITMLVHQPHRQCVQRGKGNIHWCKSEAKVYIYNYG